MFKHTPGPWFVGEINHKKQRVDIDSKTPCPVTLHRSWEGLARCYGVEDNPTIGSEIMLANANLIASAPELLAALKDVMGWVPGPASWHTDEPMKALERARAAIEKARGES